MSSRLPSSNARTLELSGSELTLLVEQAMRRLCQELDQLESALVSCREHAAEAARWVNEPLPAAGQPVEQVLGLLFERLLPLGQNTISPNYFGYIPGGGLPHAAVADLIAGVVNRYIGVWEMSPGLAQIETVVVEWLCQIMGYGKRSSGFLTSGGSLANGTAVALARRHRLGSGFEKGRIYVSDQAHHSMTKAAVLAGFDRSQVQQVSTDSEFRVNVAELAERMSHDRAKGLRPCLIVGNAGTTNTGAIDDLGALAELARKHATWLHVDAAYGGFFALTNEGKRHLAGIEAADSITLDPHKGLFLPYGTGALLAKRERDLIDLHRAAADYLPEPRGDEEFVDHCDLSPELTRSFRGLRIWLPVKMHGIEPFRQNLEEKLQLANWLAEQLSELPEVELVTKPQLSIVTFRLRQGSRDRLGWERINRRLLDEINQRQKVFLTATRLQGCLALRVCVLSFRTHAEHVERCFEEIRLGVRAVLSED